ncbi:hypothetical protein PRIPAC_90505 [Pristionchus pacificus]|uniref:Uncharacterized protein n=1 Tax=Pristionchus pacificus TaxID=54126 RepID=A0A2A6B5N0_PRIPA|nr:hypothetical protein PRIPAC_90505 [Pristionchus pacificus]|eukprot:PDM61161.1 hypothetical protein PRIPAC_50603 [Pristionchus pacificus]
MTGSLSRYESLGKVLQVSESISTVGSTALIGESQIASSRLKTATNIEMFSLLDLIPGGSGELSSTIQQLSMSSTGAEKMNLNNLPSDVVRIIIGMEPEAMESMRVTLASLALLAEASTLISRVYFSFTDTKFQYDRQHWEEIHERLRMRNTKIVFYET